ncbi:MAG: MFS transporter, partial [Actinomycetota bacterium]|nr:MFS transporter [Actinomycetota bacterium]
MALSTSPSARPGGLRQRVAAQVEDSPRYRTLILATTLFGLFTVGFTITILAVSLSTIAEDLGSSKTTLTWAITGPLLAFGIVGPAFGKAGDLWGHRRIYLFGLAAEAVLAVGIASAWDAPSLITFRVLGAAGGAACGPASMALIYSIFPPERRVQAMGWWAMVMAGGPVLGVVAGGPVVEALSWRWIFVVQVPLTLIALAVAALVLPETERRPRTRFDVAGTVLLGLAVTSLLLGLNRGPILGWSSPVVLGTFLASPVLLWLFLCQERRVEHPLIRPEYFRRRNVAAPVATQFFTNFAYMGGFILTPFFLAEVFGYGATRIGLLSIARPLAFSLSAPIGGWVAIRVGERRAGMAGAGAVAASMVCLGLLDGGSSDILVMFSLALSGVGLGASSPSMAATVANAVDPDDLGIAGASQQLIAQVGVVAGIQLMQTVQVARVGADGLVGSYHAAYLLGALVCCGGIVTAAFIRRSTRPAPTG